MARSAHPDSAGSQFFIVHGDAKFLDKQYTAFGEQSRPATASWRACRQYPDPVRRRRRGRARPPSAWRSRASRSFRRQSERSLTVPRGEAVRSSFWPACPPGADGALAANGAWICVQSPHFTVLTPGQRNAMPTNGRSRWNSSCRGMNAMFHARGPQPPRCIVVLFKNSDEFSGYKPLEGSKPAEAGRILPARGRPEHHGPQPGRPVGRRCDARSSMRPCTGTPARRTAPTPLARGRVARGLFHLPDMIDDNTLPVRRGGRQPSVLSDPGRTPAGAAAGADSAGRAPLQ